MSFAARCYSGLVSSFVYFLSIPRTSQRKIMHGISENICGSVLRQREKVSSMSDLLGKISDFLQI